MTGPVFKTEAEQIAYNRRSMCKLIEELLEHDFERAAMINGLRSRGYVVSKSSTAPAEPVAYQARTYAEFEILRVGHILQDRENVDLDAVRLLVERGWEQGFGAARSSEVR